MIFLLLLLLLLLCCSCSCAPPAATAPVASAGTLARLSGLDRYSVELVQSLSNYATYCAGRMNGIVFVLMPPSHVHVFLSETQKRERELVGTLKQPLCQWCLRSFSSAGNEKGISINLFVRKWVTILLM